ncbi:acyltransferase [Variovorax ureilyticus]|uniref:Acyltransferase n=1 Tax=Variovorax ureilyticus TaxID=1836198 RepID=A0ABU8VJC2_9BURK
MGLPMERTIGGALPAQPRARAASPALAYIPSLDGIRGIAVLLVMASHALGVFGGMLGVDAFFVLSGFLITTLLIHEFDTGTSLAVFYWRRFLRLMPALVIVVLVVYAAYPLLPGTGSASRECELLAPLMGVANWTMPFGRDCPLYMGHSWSLGVEEQFYLLWPVILFVCLRVVGKKGAIGIALMLAGACAAWRASLSLNDAPIERIYWPFDTRCDGMLVGAAAGLLMTTEAAERLFELARKLWLPATIGIGAMVALGVGHEPFFRGGYTVFALLCAIVIVAASRTTNGALDRALSFKPLVYLGTLSYGFYLWHYPVVLYISRQAGAFWPKVGVMFLLTLGASYASRRFVEVPMLRLRTAVHRRPWLGWVTATSSALLILLGLSIFWP